MRAAVLRELGGATEIRDDVELTPPGPGEVRVKLAATGVCHSDLSARTGTFPMPFPFVPGHEGAGEVVEVGEGVHGLYVGDHVIASWLPPCGTCIWCRAGQPNLCLQGVAKATLTPHFRIGDEAIYGFSGTGTFAEEVVLPEEGAIAIPNDVPLDVASLLGCGVMTGVGAAINTARVAPGS